jgi:deoxyribonuclease-4
MIFGAHMSTSGGPAKAMERGASIGCGIVQIFVKNNMQWTGRPPTPEDIAAFAAARKQAGFKAVFAHTGYLINPGGPPSANRTKSLQSLIQEITFADALDLPFLVLHPGAHLGDGEQLGLERIVAGLDEVFAATKKSKVRIALENTAGQGSCLGYKVEHLAAIFEGVKTPARLGLCLDTAHFFASGFDIRTAAGWDAAIQQVDSLVGLKQILARAHLDTAPGRMERTPLPNPLPTAWGEGIRNLHGGSVEMRPVSPRGEGLFQTDAVFRRNEPGAGVAAVQKSLAPGSLAIVYGVPETVADGTVILQYRYIRVFAPGDYSISDFDYGRFGDPVRYLGDLSPTPYF